MKKDIRNLLVVLGAGVGAAVCAALWMLAAYGPAGTYVARNVLLSPQTLQSLVKQEVKKGAKSTLIFEGIDFAYYDRAKKRIDRVAVAPEVYSQFYALVADEKSLDEVPVQVVASFSQAPSTLTLRLRTEGHERMNQEIDFLGEGDYYRVQLNQHEKGDVWATFYHPQISTKVFELFKGQMR